MDYEKIYKRVESRYIISIVLLILLLTLGQIAIQYKINHGKDMSTVINVSGRQRMLSQKITKEILMIYEKPNSEDMRYHLEELELSLDKFDKSHYNLINGNKNEGIVVDNCQSVIKLFDDIDPEFQKILSSGYQVLEITKQEDYNKQQILEEIKVIAENEKIFLKKMNTIVSHYNGEAKDNILYIERLESIIFIINIAGALLITRIIFIPATKTLRYAFLEINEKNNNITSLFQTMKGAFILVNKKGDIVNNNLAAEKIIDIEKFKTGEHNIETTIRWFGINIKNVIEDVISGEEFDREEVKIEDEYGDVLTFLVSITKGMYKRQEVLLISAYDITAQKKAENVLKNLAVKDELTKLYNRHFLELTIEDEIAKSERYDYPISIAILDIDDFKKINDKWGHPVGDIVLKEIADILKRESRKSDYQIRIGGEEFIVFMPYTNIEGAYIVAEKIRKTIEDNVNTIVGSYTASFGVAQRKAGESYLELYNRIDEALYKAKSSGKNCIVKSTSDEMPKVEAYLDWKEEWNSGNEIIDYQHRELVGIINKIIEDYSENSQSDKNLINQLDMLINHIEEHFEFEEKVLTEIKYENRLEHQKTHSDLLKKAYKLRLQTLRGEIKLQKFLEFIHHDLIIGHTLKEDTKFFRCIKDKE